MAVQQEKPPPWRDSFSDGCTGVWDWFGSHEACVQHDKRSYYGGDTEEFLNAAQEFYNNLYSLGFPWTWGYARVRYIGVRTFGKRYWNWLGPGTQKTLDTLKEIL